MEDEKKKTGYQATWQDQLKETANKIINREKFSYDLNGDALWKQYKDRYTQQGKQAMMDTMGQAQAMTGGYGNSYAHSVGQQAYQGYMQGLNDKIPALYQLALDKYITEGNQMRDNMNLMLQQDDIEYGRYRDQLADKDAAYSKLLALMTGYGYQPTPEEMAAAGMTEAQYRAIMGISDPSVSSGGGGRGSGGLTYDTQGYTVEEIKAMQEAAGIAVDGIWGTDTQNAYDSGFRPDSGSGNNDITYSDVALSAAQLKQAGATKQEINEYINSAVQGSNYKPSSSVSQDIIELKAGYVGSGR